MRRRADSGVRAELAQEYRRMALYDEPAGGYFGRFADALEAGEPVVVRAWEIGAGVHGHVRVESDGAIRWVNWDESERRWVEVDGGG